MSESSNPFDANTGNSPCGCGGPTADVDGLGAEAEALPTAEEMEAALQAAVGDTTFATEDLELATADLDLSAEEELAFAGLDTSSVPSLESILGIAEKYPGLKITFSF